MSSSMEKSNHATDTQEAFGLVQHGRVLISIGVDDNNVVGTVGHARKNIQRPTSNKASAGRLMSERYQCLTRVPLVLGFGVDAGQHASGRHSLEKCRSRYSCPGADLDDCLGLHACCEECQEALVAGETGETPNSWPVPASTGSGSGIQESANWAKVTVDGEFGDVDDMGDALSSSSR